MATLPLDLYFARQQVSPAAFARRQACAHRTGLLGGTWVGCFSTCFLERKQHASYGSIGKTQKQIWPTIDKFYVVFTNT